MEPPNEVPPVPALILRPVGRPRVHESNETPEEAEARRARSRAYNAANAARLKAYYAQWRLRNGDKTKEYCRQYHLRQKAQLAAAAAAAPN